MPFAQDFHDRNILKYAEINKVSAKVQLVLTPEQGYEFTLMDT